MTVLINGIADPDGVISVYDPMVTRGDGCFESIRSYGGTLFRLGQHLERLARSAAALEIPLPIQADIAAWAEYVAAEAGDCSVRILASAGQEGGHSVVVVFPLPVEPLPESTTLQPVAAPWHPAGAAWELAGVKTLSYAPNMAATRTARRAGRDDALLIGREGQVLELPTGSIGWLHDGVLETPELGLGILASITRDVVLELAAASGIPCREGTWTIDRLDAADEVMVWSTVREVMPVTAIGDQTYPVGAVTKQLAADYGALLPGD